MRSFNPFATKKTEKVPYKLKMPTWDTFSLDVDFEVSGDVFNKMVDELSKRLNRPIAMLTDFEVTDDRVRNIALKQMENTLIKVCDDIKTDLPKFKVISKELEYMKFHKEKDRMKVEARVKGVCIAK